MMRKLREKEILYFDKLTTTNLAYYTCIDQNNELYIVSEKHFKSTLDLISYQNSLNPIKWYKITSKEKMFYIELVSWKHELFTFIFIYSIYFPVILVLANVFVLTPASNNRIQVFKADYECPIFIFYFLNFHLTNVFTDEF